MTLLNKTPNLKYSLELCEINCKKFIKTVSSIIKNKEIRIYFALKTNDSENIRRLIYSTGIGAEVITENELESATKANVNIVVNGHYKSDRMLVLHWGQIFIIDISRYPLVVFTLWPGP